MVLDNAVNFRPTNHPTIGERDVWIEFDRLVAMKVECQKNGNRPIGFRHVDQKMKWQSPPRRSDLNRDFLTHRFAGQSVTVFRFNMKLELRSFRWRPAVDLCLE